MRVQITTLPNTPITAPLVTTVRFMQGLVITREVISIPKGHAFLTGIQLTASGHAGIDLPESGSNVQWITDDGRELDYHKTIQLEAPHYEIVIRTYNLDSVYTHSFYIDLE